ncbi:MAG TPA: hypothetical protein VMX17_16790 [Candidatus Glassbacteria bacterium]|nr:hypothetical protein [Candidatus Glassbacteria bacterium]
MVRISTKTTFLLVLFTFALIYRLMFMHWDIYPSGADIGLHNSVLNSITTSGGTDFQWNFYQMGGGFSLTFPGYHIFVSYVVLLTGLPNYIAFSLTVALFSSLLVFCSFLVTRVAWSESAGIIVAFLVAISRFDIEMLLWGGYPNAAALTLIPIIFYLYLERKNFSHFSLICITGLLSATIFLSHSLTSVMFVSITILTVIAIMAFSKRLKINRGHIFVWILPLIVGFILVFPFLMNVIPAYLGANGGTFTGGVSGIQQALLSTRVLPMEWILPLFGSVFLFLLFSKKYQRKFLSIPAILFMLWLLVPVLSTQGYLVGLYVDYNRFLYFVILPLIVLIGLGIDHGSSFFARIISTYLTLTKKHNHAPPNLTNEKPSFPQRFSQKNLYIGFTLAFLIISFLTIPIFLTPFQGRTIQSFYQVMSDPGYDAILWAKQYTPNGSLFVSDALYGWWFSGFAQRPTLSAVDPQFLTLAREFEPAQIANNLLDTDYVIDNGLIQIREDGGYLDRHNPIFLAKLNWTYFPYPFFHFSNDKAAVQLDLGNNSYKTFELSDLPVLEMSIANDSTQAHISVKKGNYYFNYSQTLTVYEGEKFVNMTISIDTENDFISIIDVNYILQSKGELVQSENTIGFIDEGAKVLGQLIFSESNLPVINELENFGMNLFYEIGNSKVDLQLLISVFSITDDLVFYQTAENRDLLIKEILDSNLILTSNPDLFSGNKELTDLPIEVFSYSDAIVDWSISYIACRDSALLPKFVKDPGFSLVFINDEVAIFKVNSSFFQEG